MLIKCKLYIKNVCHKCQSKVIVIQVPLKITVFTSLEEDAEDSPCMMNVKWHTRS